MYARLRSSKGDQLCDGAVMTLGRLRQLLPLRGSGSNYRIVVYMIVCVSPPGYRWQCLVPRVLAGQSVDMAR